MSQTEATEKLVYGLDIGTRSIVGTVGYKTGARAFTVVAQSTRLHATRAMMDGQIHDIASVANTIAEVTKELEAQTGQSLKEVCIAAAGRVLNTTQAFAEVEFEDETVVDADMVHTLEMMGVEKAHKKMREETKDAGQHFFCVAYTVVHYYLNGFVITNLEEHKASKIGVEVLATFLPNEVIDGLYAAVEKAGLTVGNLTLEPIAAMLVAIPENFRLLNIALVDVGAGTSDICITRDGSVIGYGMIPMAGDMLTETIAKKRLVDYNSAERMKLETSTKKKAITYTDIMGLKQKADREAVLSDISEEIDVMAEAIATQIASLNGGKPVSAVFVVGGGGKIAGFTELLSEKLNVPKERVALRGEEVLSFVTFLQEGIKKDSLLVTPIGICLNYYEQKNNFVFVKVNDEHIKLYDNGNLTVGDAALQFGFSNEELFPMRGKELNFTVNGVKRTVKGKLGEAAEILLNGQPVGINAPIVQNDKLKISVGTKGTDASCTVEKLPEYKQNLNVTVNGVKMTCPRIIQVNGEPVSENYEIKEGDIVTALEYYTLSQLLAYFDIVPTEDVTINGTIASSEAKVYDGSVVRTETEKKVVSSVEPEKKNFSVEPDTTPAPSNKEEEFRSDIYLKSYDELDDEDEPVEFKRPPMMQNQKPEDKAGHLLSLLSALNADESSLKFGKSMSTQYVPIRTGQPLPPLEPFVPGQKDASRNETAAEQPGVVQSMAATPVQEEKVAEVPKEEPATATGNATKDIVVVVNGQAKVLKGKSAYLLVDVLDVVSFNLSDARGRQPIVKVNGASTTFMQAISDGDKIELGWK